MLFFLFCQSREATKTGRYALERYDLRTAPSISGRDGEWGRSAAPGWAAGSGTYKLTVVVGVGGGDLRLAGEPYGEGVREGGRDRVGESGDECSWWL